MGKGVKVVLVAWGIQPKKLLNAWEKTSKSTT